jgi:hypothetical protein
MATLLLFREWLDTDTDWDRDRDEIGSPITASDDLIAVPVHEQ